jgi:hypothetical protein
MTAAERQRRHRAGLTFTELPPEPADVAKIRQAALRHLYKMRDAEGKYGRERTWTGRELLRLRKRIEAKGWPWWEYYDMHLKAHLLSQRRFEKIIEYAENNPSTPDARRRRTRRR